VKKKKIIEMRWTRVNKNPTIHENPTRVNEKRKK
jgi:hypothetical protein